MAITRSFGETVHGVAGQECHGGCGHVFVYLEDKCYRLFNVTHAYEYWCADCVADYPEDEEVID